MTVEEQLKELILSRFKSVRAFAIAIDVPPSTINNIFTRGIGGVRLGTAIPMCIALNIDIAYLVSGEIRSKDIALQLEPDEEKLLNAYRSFNAEGQERLLQYAVDMTQLDRYKKVCGKSDLA